MDREGGRPHRWRLGGRRLLRPAVASRSSARAPAAGGPRRCPPCSVVDAPRFGYRGLMLDVARNFQPKARCSRSSTSWRATSSTSSISTSPRTKAGASRSPACRSSRRWARGAATRSTPSAFLQPAFGSGPDVDRPFGSGFYSQADYIEILRYAAARHIEVVPEIEMPGHARAAIKAMEARIAASPRRATRRGPGSYLLSDPDDPSVYTSAQAYGDNVMNPALASTYAFIEKVVAEVAALHAEAGVPLRNIHMGGDEVPGGVWEKSPVAQAYLKDQGLGGVDDLWFVFYGRVEQILKPHGITPSGWEEIGVRKTRLDGRPRTSPTPASRSGAGAPTCGTTRRAGGRGPGVPARERRLQGRAVSREQPLLRPRLRTPAPKSRASTGAATSTCDKPFDFIPFDYYRNVARGPPRGAARSLRSSSARTASPTTAKPNIVGVEGYLWSETLRRRRPARLHARPQAPGLAERAWAPDPALGARARTRPKADVALPRGVVALRERRSASASCRASTASCRDSATGSRRRASKVDGGRGALQPRAPRLHAALHDGRQRADRARARWCAGRSAARDVSVAAFDTNGRKGHTAKLQAP